jgi:hypothetical protein
LARGAIPRSRESTDSDFPDVGEVTEKSCRHRNGGEAGSVTRRKFCDIWKTINVEMIETQGGGKKRKVGRRIIEHTGASVKTRITREVEITWVEFHIIEHWNHGAKYAQKNPGYFDEWPSTKLIRFEDALRSEKYETIATMSIKGARTPFGTKTRMSRSARSEPKFHFP